jgi:hypothetical protein
MIVMETGASRDEQPVLKWEQSSDGDLQRLGRVDYCDGLS